MNRICRFQRTVLTGNAIESKTLLQISAISVVALVIPMLVCAQEATKAKAHHRYRFIDIGTFGGPASYINPPYNAVFALNSDGTIVGSSATSIPTEATSNGFLCPGGLEGVLPFVFHAFREQEGVVSDLGAHQTSEKNCSNAVSINKRGNVVGISEIDAIDPIAGVKELHSLIWKAHGIVDLGTLGGSYTIATQINDRDQVVGGATNLVLDPFSIFGTQYHAFLWQD